MRHMRVLMDIVTRYDIIITSYHIEIEAKHADGGMFPSAPFHPLKINLNLSGTSNCCLASRVGMKAVFCDTIQVFYLTLLVLML